jgi:methylase of polypeptide subunit release factors
MNVHQFTNIKQVSYNNIKINYLISGGGDAFGQHYINFMRDYYRDNALSPDSNILEWCAGAGFIGFSLLAHGLCKHISFIEQDANDVICSNLTIGMNNIQKDALSIVSNTVNAFSDTTQFDIIVGNPPHFGDDISNAINSGSIPRITNDQGWEIHTEFFRNVQKYMHSNSRIILIQNNKDVPNGANELKQVATDNGLQFLNIYDSESGIAVLDNDASLLPSSIDYYFLELALVNGPGL